MSNIKRELVTSWDWSTEHILVERTETKTLQHFGMCKNAERVLERMFHHYGFNAGTHFGQEIFTFCQANSLHLNPSYSSRPSCVNRTHNQQK